MKKINCNNGSFEDLSGKQRRLEIDELSSDIKIDGKPIGFRFSRYSKSYLSQKGEKVGTVSELGTVVEFCKSFLQKTPDFA